MLAHAVLPLLAPDETLALARGDLDVTDQQAVQAAVSGFRPGIILHLAAFTDVDGAEAEPERAHAVNAIGAENVARAAAALGPPPGALFVYVSTDYVFDGTATRPYREDDVTRPLSVYGATKLEGEARSRAACPRTLIVRTAWLFGPGGRGRNFVDTVAARLDEGVHISVVADQVGRPTYTRDLAPALLSLAGVSPGGGTYHLTNTGPDASRYDVAREVAVVIGAEGGLVSPTTSDERARPARRPAYSVLDVNKAAGLGVGPLRDWRQAVRTHLGAGSGAVA